MSHPLIASPLASLRCVRVGTTNAPKLEAVRLALADFAPGVTVTGVAVESGVPEQPLGFDEIALGAQTRALRALRANASGECDLGVGIEDGLVELPAPGSVGGTGVVDLVGGTGALGAAADPVQGRPAQGRPALAPVNVGCAAVSDGTRVSLGYSSGFAYPPYCSERAVRERAPIGDVFDRYWAERRGELHPPLTPSGRGLGNVGKLTLGALPRSEYARHAVMCALVAFLHPDLYGASDQAA